MSEGKLQWHPAFSAALRIELEEELDALYIEEEHILGRKPMQMDVLVIKKERDVPIKKNIGRIFRKHNIIEYKAPGDSLSINDFYKVYGYACFYQSDTKKIMEIDPEELTITYVCNHYPYKLLKHLEKVRGIRACKQEPGIYYLQGDAVRMQLVISKKLSEEENYWLKNLRDDLKEGEEITRLLERYEDKKNEVYYSEVMDLIVRANWERMKEEKKVCEALRELFADELRESEERGMKQGRVQGLEQGRVQGLEQGLEQGENQGIKLAKRVFKLARQHAG